MTCIHPYMILVFIYSVLLLMRYLAVVINNTAV